MEAGCDIMEIVNMTNRKIGLVCNGKVITLQSKGVISVEVERKSKRVVSNGTKVKVNKTEYLSSVIRLPEQVDGTVYIVSPLVYTRYRDERPDFYIMDEKNDNMNRTAKGITYYSAISRPVYDYD